MVTGNQKTKNDETKQILNSRIISMPTSIFYFVISLVINSAGNVLTLVTSAKIHPSFLGAAYWTAGEANLGVALGWNLFWAFLIFGILITILNAILVHHWDWRRALGNLIFMIPFSALIQVFQNFFIGKYQIYRGLSSAHTPGMVIFYILVNFFGVALIGTAISIYQRVNLVLHPADDLMQILRFRYFNGNANIAMWTSYIPPTLMLVLAFVVTKNFVNLGLGTIFALLFQGGITGVADRIIFPNLKHQALDVGESKTKYVI